MSDSHPFLQVLERVAMAVPLSADHTDELLTKLQGLVSNLSWSPDKVIELFKALLKRFDSNKIRDKDDLKLWMLKMLHCIEINYITPSWKSGETLLELIRDTTKTDNELEKILGANTEKTLDEILEEIKQKHFFDQKLLDDTKEIVAAVSINSQLNPTRYKEKQHLKAVLQRLVAAVKKTQNITPRLTQMVSWCIMALSAKGRLIQVSTGEGKTCIIAMFAAFRALQGDKVDIMSSSPVLAERDFKAWQNFYKELKITVGCNFNNRDLKKCYKCQVVYGTSQGFGADWLRHHFSREGIRGNRPFQCAIVDEVDSLMLDKGNHTVYLGGNIPGLLHLNSLLAHIWHAANQYTTEGPYILGPTILFHQVVLENLSSGKTDQMTVLKLAENTGLLNKGSVNALKQDPSLFPQITANITPEKLAFFFRNIEGEHMKYHFVLYKQDNGSIRKVNAFPQNNEPQTQISLLLHSGGVCQYIYHDRESLVKAAKSEVMSTLHFTPCDERHGRTNCYVPSFLRDLVEYKMEHWIEMAFYAQTITKDHQYVVESHGVVPVDFGGTGVLENCMEWTEGLHQFLQMKHQNKLSDMSAVTNFMSNVGLLHMYGDQIYGVTGTLGQRVETETLQKIYNGISTYYIPTYKRRKLFEVEGVILNNAEEWLQRICQVIRAQISCTSYRSERAVLVICETISRAKAIHEALGPSVQNKALYISNNEDNRAITDNEIQAGRVIIATNLAGRGTDLQVSAEVNSAGGLFVLQTFLPTNARVEAQAFGRTGRQGNPGSAQLIICSTHLPKTLEILVLTRGLLSVLRDMVSPIPLYREMFEMQLRLYRSDQINNGMSETLTQILTRTSDVGIKLAKLVRDESVAVELNNYLESGIPEMKMKQELFSQYLDFIDAFYQDNNNQPTESDVSALHEFWCLWLLMNVTNKDLSNNLKTKLTSDLERARETLRRRQSPVSNLHHYTIFGNELLKKGHFEAGIQMFSKAIEEDRCWAAIAFYNRALARLIQQDNNQSPVCIDQALRDLQRALNSVELYCHQVDIVYRFSKPHLGAVPLSAHTRFDHHQNMRCKVFLLFKQNIIDAIGKLTKAKNTGGHVKVETHLVHFMAPLIDYLPLLTLTAGSVRDLLRSADELTIQQINNHSALDIFNEFQCLMSLGLTTGFVLDNRFSFRGFLSKIGRSLLY